MNYSMETTNTLKEINTLIRDNRVTNIHKFEQLLATLPSDIKTKVIRATGYESGWLFVGADFASLEDRISALVTKDSNKLKVYQGHIVYEISVNGTCHHIRDDATISYDGNSYTGEEFYELYTNGKL